MIIGVDFDNTIAGYDDLMIGYAVKAGVASPGEDLTKREIRDRIRATENGETAWRRLQATVYGDRMGEAVLMAGVTDFFRAMSARSIPLYIISHKTERAAEGASGVNLREVALSWMKTKGFFSDESLGLSLSSIYFEATREEKIARIRSLGCTHFIDDLVETFVDPSFPEGVIKILFARSAPDPLPVGIRHRSNWREIKDVIENEGLAKTIDNLTGAAPSDIELVAGGRNSRVYKVYASDGRLYAAKWYHGKTMEGRDRLSVETKSVRFLRRHGETSVPELFAVNSENSVALFDFIDGEPVSALSAADIDQLTDFLLRLERLARLPESESLPTASAACLRLADINDQIRARLDRFSLTAPDSPEFTALDDFLTNRFKPTLARFSTQVDGIDYKKRLERKEMTLSPSDTGFHNAMRRPDGGLVFFDFEYFGWDDPAKMILDVLLHPGMDLTLANKKRFIDRMVPAFSESLKYRLSILYPLVGLKWITILLNEFVAADRKRREFASDESWENESRILRRQLEKAERALEKLYDNNNETAGLLRI